LALCCTRINSLSLRQWPSRHHLESTRGPTRLPSDVCSSVFKDPGGFYRLPTASFVAVGAALMFGSGRGVNFFFSAVAACSASSSARNSLTGSASKGAPYKRSPLTTQEAFFRKAISPRSRASGPHRRSVRSPRGDPSRSSGARRGSPAGTTTTRCSLAPRSAPPAQLLAHDRG